MTTPVVSLLIFSGICLLLFLIFYPKRGWYWSVKRRLKDNDKTLIEDILKTIYHSENIGSKSQVTDLINSFDTPPEKIINTIANLEQSGFINTLNGEIELNHSGREYALKIIRVHRLWEKYLAEKTGFHKKDWHDIAEKMEHQLTLEQTNQLALDLGNPRYDPHGDPIPTESGEIFEIQGNPMSSFPAGTTGQIIHIEDEPEIIYQQILAANLHIGSLVRILETNKKRIQFYSEGEEYVLAPIIARNITLKELKKEDHYPENTTRLSNLKVGERAKIVGISRECRGEIRKRLLDLGFVKNTSIQIDMESPLLNPKAYVVKDASIAIRNEQANYILIEKE